MDIKKIRILYDENYYESIIKTTECYIIFKGYNHFYKKSIFLKSDQQYWYSEFLDSLNIDIREKIEFVKKNRIKKPKKRI